MSTTLFDMPKAQVPRIDALPVSVLEVGAQTSERRDVGSHDSQSSRARYSHFPAEVCGLCFQLFLRDATLVFDPFAGWGERHSAAIAAGRRYVGFDINPHAIAEAERVYGVQNTLADSREAPIPAFDGLLTCPPYWNLEAYSDSGIDACRGWEEFLSIYGSILGRCWNAAKPGAVFCIMTGDWRADHHYYDLTHQTRSVMERMGATFWDEVIVSRASVTKIKIMIPQAVKLGYTVKLHETLSVFKKGRS